MPYNSTLLYCYYVQCRTRALVDDLVLSRPLSKKDICSVVPARPGSLFSDSVVKCESARRRSRTVPRELHVRTTCCRPARDISSESRDMVCRSTWRESTRRRSCVPPPAAERKSKMASAMSTKICFRKNQLC